MAPLVSPNAEEKVPLRNVDLTPSNDEEDPYAPPDLVTPDAPTEEWFWSRFDLALLKVLPPAENARRVAVMKANEKKRAEEEVAKAAQKVEELELWQEACRHVQDVEEYARFITNRAKGANPLLAAWRCGRIALSMPPMKSSFMRLLQWPGRRLTPAGKPWLRTSGSARRRR